MHRVFAGSADIFKPFRINDRNEIHHAWDVLRLKENEKIIAFDGKGNEVLAIIKNINKSEIVAEPQGTITKNEKKPFSITLACALPKRARFDFIVEKTTELGVDTIIPLITKRTEIRLSKERQILKQKHWLKVAISASKQSQRATIPQISEVKTFNSVLGTFDNYELVLLPCLSGERKSLKEILKEISPKKILILIGPEGDFAQEEVSSAVKKKAKPVTFGKTVLRVDTAAIYAVSAISAILI